MTTYVRHHIKYKDIHGVDEVVMMETGEHHSLHDRLRREGKCNIPVSVLKKISLSSEHHKMDVRIWLREHRIEHRLYCRKEYMFKRTVASRLRPDIISIAMTPALRPGRALAQHH